jgi:hypothetical protein
LCERIDEALTAAVPGLAQRLQLAPVA